MVAPKLQILSRKIGSILFGWIPLPASHVTSYRLYTANAAVGPYTLFRSDIGISPSKEILGHGKVILMVRDNEVPIIGLTPIYFKLTAVDEFMVESNITDSNPVTPLIAGINTTDEGENGERNIHNYGWNNTRKAWTKLIVNDAGALSVDAVVNVGSITLSDVKVAARSDNTTLEYLLVTNDRKLVVSIPDPITTEITTSIATYEPTDDVIDSVDAVVIPTGVETNILLHSPALDFQLVNVTASGTSDAVYRLRLNGGLVATKRTSWTDRNIDFNFGKQGIKVSSLDTLTITAQHEEVSSQTFDAGLFGYITVII